MNRRDVLGSLALAAGGWPFAAHAQSNSSRTIGFLSSRSERDSEKVLAAFRNGLREGGLTEGSSLGVNYEWAEGHLDRLAPLAVTLTRQPVSLIVAVGGSNAAIAARTATATIPIVYVIGGDPVKLGLAESLSRPGGNATGITIISADLAPKRFGLLRELLPQASSFATLANPVTPEGQRQGEDALAATQTMGVTHRLLRASNLQEIEAAFASLARERVDALLVASDPIFDVNRDAIVRLAARAKLPAMYQFRDFVVAGGLISYDPDIADAYRQAGLYVSKILSGTKASDLPVLQSNKFQLAINVKTATELGISVPNSILARADEVIE